MIQISSPCPFLEAFVDGATGWLVLNRPERRNALNAEMWAAIPPLMQALDGHPAVRVIVAATCVTLVAKSVAVLGDEPSC